MEEEEEGKELHCSRRWPACGGASGAGGGGTYLFEFPAASYVSERVWCFGAAAAAAAPFLLAFGEYKFKSKLCDNLNNHHIFCGNQNQSSVVSVKISPLEWTRDESGVV